MSGGDGMNKARFVFPAEGAYHREDHEFPAVTTRLGWRYHHVGIPTEQRHPGEVHIPPLGMYVSAFNTSPSGVQWMRFDPDSPVNPLLRRVPHVAFVVDDLDSAVVGWDRIGEINSPSPGVRVAMILDHGAPVELLEFSSGE